MSKKFDDFKAALSALCVEHKVRLVSDYDYRGTSVVDSDVDEDDSVLDLDDGTAQTPEEAAKTQAELEERYRLADIESATRRAQWAALEAKRLASMAEAGSSYSSLRAYAEALANEQRKKLMRICTDPQDPAFIDDRPRKVWLRDREIEDWFVADEFRRVIQLTDGTVLNGDVRIERLPAIGEAAIDVPATRPIDTGFSGVFEPVPVQAPVPMAAVVPEPVDPEPQAVPAAYAMKSSVPVWEEKGFAFKRKKD